MRTLAATLSCIGLLGGSLLAQPAAADSAAARDGLTFEKSRARTDQAPKNNAVAVAVDAGQWAWGTASSAASEDQAKDLALRRCREQAGVKGVASACELYSVNGQPIYFDPK